MRKLLLLVILAISLTFAGCNMNPQSDSSQGTEESPSDTPETKPDDTTPSDPSDDSKPSQEEEQSPSTSGDEEKPSTPAEPRNPTTQEKNMIDTCFEALQEAQRLWLMNLAGEDIDISSVVKFSHSFSAKGRVFSATLNIKNYIYKEGNDTILIDSAKVIMDTTCSTDVPADADYEWLMSYGTEDNTNEYILAMDMTVETTFNYNNVNGNTMSCIIMTSDAEQKVKDLILNEQSLVNYEAPLDEAVVTPPTPTFPSEEIS